MRKVKISTHNQTPNFLWVPEYASSAGDEAIELAEQCGLIMDPWQQLVLREGLGENKVDGEWEWSAFEVCTLVSRQNGKGSIIEARELAGLFLFNEKLIIHTAHEFKTSAEEFGRILTLIESNPDLDSKVKRVATGKGSEVIELKNGCRLRYLSRSKGSGRGFTCDCLIMDESMILGEAAMAALLPTMSAKKNPQVWYFGTAGIGEESSQLALMRGRAMGRKDKSLAYMEWSAEVHDEFCMSTCTDHLDIDDPAAWLRANPGLPYRHGSDEGAIKYITKEHAAMGPAMFSRERLGNGTYPEIGLGNSPFTVAEWMDLRYGVIQLQEAKPGPDVVFAVDISPDRRSGVIASYSLVDGGKGHVELVFRESGTEWIVEKLMELKSRWNPLAIVIDGKGPARSLLLDLKDADIFQPASKDNVRRGDLLVMSTSDMQEACGNIVDAVRHGTIRHLGDEVLSSAIYGASMRPVGDAWVWTRRKSTVDIAALVAVTMARYAYEARISLVKEYDVLQSAY